MLKEFRAFIMRGNVLDLAVGVIIGAAFGAIVTSLVDDVIMPPIGLALGGVDFSDIKIVLQQANPATETAEVAIYIGRFVNALINFLIIALCVFFIIRAFARIQSLTTRKEQEEVKEELPPTTEQLMLEELRALRSVIERRGPPAV